VLGEGVPRQVQDLYRSVWLNLNAVYPRKLWLLTVNNLRVKESVVSRNLTQEELALDPLAVLRCNERVFRSGEGENNKAPAHYFFEDFFNINFSS
jgi:integrator complex subunit 2